MGRHGDAHESRVIEQNKKHIASLQILDSIGDQGPIFQIGK